MTKLQRAKKQTRKKWQNILKVLPRITKSKFDKMAFDDRTCGFCVEYNTPRRNYVYCPKCPICNNGDCKEMQMWARDINEQRCWRKDAIKLCKWVLKAINKIW